MLKNGHPLSPVLLDDNDEMLLSQEYEKFVNKCAICFTEEANIHIGKCQDQLCIECFEEYLGILIKESGWGFGGLKLDCPICHGILITDDWYPWVREDLIEMYECARRSKNQIGKFCKKCGHKQQYIPKKYITDDDNDSEEEEYIGWEDLINWQMMINSEFKKEFINETSRKLVYQYVYNQIEEYEENSDNSDFSDCFELDYAVCFKKLLKIDLKYLCDCCKEEICMKCGEDNWHLNQRNCLDYYKSTLLNNEDVDWKLSNCKNCPDCWAFVEKDQSGCNEMRCTMCGCKFCWECLSSWSKRCGIYQCTNNNKEGSLFESAPKRLKSPDNILHFSNGEEGFRIEAGVPNLEMIIKNNKF